MALITWHLNPKKTTFGHKFRILRRGQKCYLTNDIFDQVVEGVKVQCSKVPTKLMVELHTCFPQHGVNEALGKVYLHYWSFENYDESFKTHFHVAKGLFCTPKKMGVINIMIIEVLCASTLNM